MNILIVDDHPVIRQSLKLLLRNLGFVFFEADNGRDAVEILETTSPPINIVILDIAMPTIDGLSVLSRVPPTDSLKYFIFSGLGENVKIGIENEFPVSGYFSKNDDVTNLINAISLTKAQMTSEEAGNITPEIVKLSSRERFILNYLGQGLSNKSIASQLSISEKTVSTYKRRAMKKLGLRTSLDIIKFYQSNMELFL